MNKPDSQFFMKQLESNNKLITPEEYSKRLDELHAKLEELY